VTLLGRARDLITRGGQNIFPGEIEELIARHPEEGGPPGGAKPVCRSDQEQAERVGLQRKSDRTSSAAMPG